MQAPAPGLAWTAPAAFPARANAASVPHGVLQRTYAPQQLTLPLQARRGLNGSAASHARGRAPGRGGHGGQVKRGGCRPAAPPPRWLHDNPACPCACNRVPCGHGSALGCHGDPGPDPSEPAPLRLRRRRRHRRLPPRCRCARAPAAAASARRRTSTAHPLHRPAPASRWRSPAAGNPASNSDASPLRQIVIGRDEIEKFGDATVGEVLRRLPHHHARRARPRGAPRMRGSAALHQLLIDGQRVPPASPWSR